MEVKKEQLSEEGAREGGYVRGALLNLFVLREHSVIMFDWGFQCLGDCGATTWKKRIYARLSKSSHQPESGVLVSMSWRVMVESPRKVCVVGLCQVKRAMAPLRILGA
jgi:hypothetical protein